MVRLTTLTLAICVLTASRVGAQATSPSKTPDEARGKSPSVFLNTDTGSTARPKRESGRAYHERLVKTSKPSTPEQKARMDSTLAEIKKRVAAMHAAGHQDTTSH
jgi:hypothetical protein